MLVSGKIPDIVDRYLDFIFLNGPADNPFPQGRGQEVGENCQNIKSHGATPRQLSRGSKKLVTSK
jgi:hypothetical protein